MAIILALNDFNVLTGEPETSREGTHHELIYFLIGCFRFLNFSVLDLVNFYKITIFWLFFIAIVF
jgi:hypothetical protein